MVADENVLHEDGSYFYFQKKAEIWRQIIEQNKDQTKHITGIFEIFMFN